MVTRPARLAASSTAECSTVVVTTWMPSPIATGCAAGPDSGADRNRLRSGPLSTARRAAPKTAAFTDSVPPEVKISSLGRAPKNAATCSRAPSRATRAARPSAWTRPGSPGWPSHGSIAS